MVRPDVRQTIIPDEKILQPRGGAVQTDLKRYKLQQTAQQKQVDAQERRNAGLFLRLHILVFGTHRVEHESVTVCIL